MCESVCGCVSQGVGGGVRARVVHTHYEVKKEKKIHLAADRGIMAGNSAATRRNNRLGKGRDWDPALLTYRYLLGTFFF